MPQGPAFLFDHLGIQGLLIFKYLHHVWEVKQCHPLAFLLGVVQSIDWGGSTLAFILASHSFCSWPCALTLCELVGLQIFQTGTEHVQLWAGQGLSFTKSQNGLGYDHLELTSLPWIGTPSTGSRCSGPHLSSPWTLQGIGKFAFRDKLKYIANASPGAALLPSGSAVTKDLVQLKVGIVQRQLKWLEFTIPGCLCSCSADMPSCLLEILSLCFQERQNTILKS